MTDPWLAFIGIGEDGPPGLSPNARAALDAAEVVFGGLRHLALAGVGARGQAWPVPFDAGAVLALRGRRVAVLASGDPFWHGAGGSLQPHLTPGEWVSHPVPSTFQLAANRLGWRLEDTACLGLHAAPLARLTRHLHRDARVICLLRDGAAPAALAAWLTGAGFGAATLHVLERLGGPAARVRSARAEAFGLTDIAAPVAVAVDIGPVPAATARQSVPGLPDSAFVHDGQITKAPVRALTLAALAPRPGDRLWDIGAGSGSVSVEFCRAGGQATAIEARPDRSANIRANAERFGLAHRMTVVDGMAPAALQGLALPDAVFVGGGCTAALLDLLWSTLDPATRLVVNAVTLDTEALLLHRHGAWGGTLTRIQIDTAAPLGPLRGWSPARPVVQWSVLR